MRLNSSDSSAAKSSRLKPLVKEESNNMEAAIVLIVFIALVIIGVPIGWSIAAEVSLIFYSRGPWKSAKSEA